jgi:Rieske Fe-S protein
MAENENAPLQPRPAWEADFPHERVEATHVSRREFAKFLCLVSGGLCAGTAFVAVKDKLLPPHRIAGEHRVCRAGDVPVGGTHAFVVPDSPTPYILIHLENGEWRAFEQKCTHLACAVFYRPGSGKIECPCHNGWFDARTGDVLQGPPPRPLPRLAVMLRGDEIFVAELEGLPPT